MKSKVTVIAICSVLILTSLAGFLLPDHGFSLREKRKLAQKPDFSWEAVGDRSYLPELESWMLDQFPGRDGWITVKTVSELLMGRREKSGVYICGNRLIPGFSGYDPARLEQNIQALKKLESQLSVPLWVLPVPSAGEIYRQELPAHAPETDQKALIRLLQAGGLSVIDPTALLEAHSEEYLYYRTDHHYTSLGAFYCYSAFRTALGYPRPDPALWQQQVLTDSFRGTGWSKVGLPWIPADTVTAWYQHPERRVVYNGTQEEHSVYQPSWLDRDPYGVFFNSNQALTAAEGSGADGVLLVIKDSFGNTFCQFPVEDYAQVHMIDLRFFRGSVPEYVRDHGITQVLVLYGLQGLVSSPDLIF